MTSRPVPMFPLGSVLLPGGVLPLHVFEPRYQQLLKDVTASDGTFGVVLITHGLEVGGGDKRADVGCLAKIEHLEYGPDGRAGVIAVGTERLTVERWLSDDPYPRAVTRRTPHVSVNAPDRPALMDRLMALHELFARLGVDEAALMDERMKVESAPDDHLAFAVARAADLGPVDCLALLSEDDPANMVPLLLEQLDGVADVLRFRLMSDD